MKRNFIVLLAVLTLLPALSACSGQPQSATTPGPTPAAAPTPALVETAEPALTPAFPITLTDAAGREVTIEEEPETLVSGYYITTSMMIALGQQDKLVGIEAKAKSRPIYSAAAPELLELPNVGSAKEFDLEGCAALEADLVILPLRLKEAAQTLTDLGLTVLTVNPESLEELDETIALLGAATGAADEAQALLDYNRETQAFLARVLEGAARPRVYLAGNGSYLNTAGSEMYQNTLIELGGGENVAAGLTDPYWSDVSYEQLLSWDPEVIIVVPGADYSVSDLTSDPQLAQLTAVQNGAVYVMEGLESWDSPVPSALVGSRWVASTLHGDLYPLENFTADMADFYRTFYGVELAGSAAGN